MQWPNEKGQNDKQWFTKNYTESLVLHCMAVPGSVR
jgi:hypothetical protein